FSGGRRRNNERNRGGGGREPGAARPNPPRHNSSISWYASKRSFEYTLAINGCDPLLVRSTISNVHRLLLCHLSGRKIASWTVPQRSPESSNTASCLPTTVGSRTS